jgi:trimeric autotransporter adhesin
LKERIRPIGGALEKLSRLNGVTFHWKDKTKNQREYLGLIAQDVEKVFPQAIDEVSDTTIGTAKTLDYAVLVAPMIEAMKELKAANDNLRLELQVQKVEIQSLRKALSK